MEVVGELSVRLVSYVVRTVGIEQYVVAIVESAVSVGINFQDATFGKVVDIFVGEYLRIVVAYCFRFHSSVAEYSNRREVAESHFGKLAVCQFVNSRFRNFYLVPFA